VSDICERCGLEIYHGDDGADNYRHKTGACASGGAVSDSTRWLLVSGPDGSRETQDVIPAHGRKHIHGKDCWCSPREDSAVHPVERKGDVLPPAKGLWIHNDIN
jgi:hypothetical protein